MKTKNERHRLAALLDEMTIRRARRSLRAFVELAWRILEPKTPFLPNWHIDLICEYLEAVDGWSTFGAWSSTSRPGT